MDDFFKPTVLTASINEMQSPQMVIYNRIFKGKEKFNPTDKLEFEVLSGSESILRNLTVFEPAQVTGKTGRKVVIVKAPRLADKKFIHTAELNGLRAYGEQLGFELFKQRIAREQKDIRNIIDRTIEYWSANALKGKILDSDYSTVLVDYNLPATHKLTLSGTDLWTDPDSDPLADIREFKRTIEEDSGAAITSWVAFIGYKVMDALLNHEGVRDFLKYDRGSQMAESGRIQRLAEVELIEYNVSFVDSTGTKRRFIDPEEFLLVGECEDVVSVPFAPIVDKNAPGGVGNVVSGKPVMYFSKSWDVEDPDGRWIKAESRPLPALQRPGAVVDAIVV
ncbi:Phage major capsid protein E [Desulfonauticus submarinus]|uniref:Phage major capsid protein E n=1 Tax=Desulfonauticus submarinus TaxID=206665 RepID=A0A1H0GB77_9BACT|nr:major capsid protein [Desulfonauticus submarinus]SDO04029.1 Phage major capsid protein E [Desulfonauticus submarinus]